VAKSSAAEHARRVNATIQLLQQQPSARVAEEMVARYRLSRRQAYRYLQAAQRASCPLAVPENKSVFTVKLPRHLIAQVRRQARRQRTSISAWVEQVLRLGLEQPQPHG
jgi:hypothetical protein